MPTVGRGEVTSLLCSQTCPSFGFIRPDTSRVSVDLPQPEGPTTAQKLFSGMRIERLSSTGSGPALVL